jgi:hypothetical protein
LNRDLRTIVRTAVVAGIAVAFQALNLRQPITGPGINAILYVASKYIGPVSGAFVGLLTPWIALITGIMRFAPAVPVIMAGNVTLALASGYLQRYNRYFAMASGAVLKFAVMTLGIRYLTAQGTPSPNACLHILNGEPTYNRSCRSSGSCYCLAWFGTVWGQ